MASLHRLFPVSNPARACAGCSIRAHCLAQGLEGECLQKFEAGRGQIRVLRRGEKLFRAGSAFDTLFVVRSGAVKVCRSGEDGEEQIVAFNLPGELVGADGIESGMHGTTAVALETSSVCAFPFRHLLAMAAESRTLQNQMLRLMSADIGARQMQFMSMARQDAEGRVAAFLLSLGMRLKRIGFSATEFRLSMGRHEIGNYLGMNLETVSRIFTRLHETGLISRDGRFIRLLDPEKLRARAGGIADLPGRRLAVC